MRRLIRVAWRVLVVFLAWTAIVTAGSAAEVVDAQGVPSPPYSCEDPETGLLLGSWVPCDAGLQPPPLLNPFLLDPRGEWLGSMFTATPEQRAALTADGQKVSVRLVTPPPPPPPDETAPTVTIDQVESPRTDAVKTVEVRFSEPMQGGRPTFRLTHNGTEIDPATCASCLSGSSLDKSWWLVPLVDTSAEGTYELNVLTDEMTDLAGNAVSGGSASVSWVVDRAPVATFEPVESPRPSGVAEVRLTFSEPVTGVDSTDFWLFRDSTPLAPLTDVTVKGSGREWVLGGLLPYTTPQTTASGYRLLLKAAGTGIVDVTGNSPVEVGDFGFAAELSFSVDWQPTATIDPIGAEPRRQPPDDVVVRFSEAMTGFGPSDLRLRRDGVDLDPTSLTVAPSSSGTVFTASGLAELADAEGAYKLAVVGGAARDSSGNQLIEAATITFTVDRTPPSSWFLTDPADPDANNGWYRSPVTYETAGEDLLDGKCALNPPSPPGSFTEMPTGWWCSLTLSQDGIHDAYAAGIDLAGNTSDVVHTTLRVDRTAPIASITVNPAPSGDDAYHTSPVDVAVDATDNLSGVDELRCVLDPEEPPTEFGDLPEEPCDLGMVSTDGAHTVYAAARDAAGNTDLVELSFQVDQTAPRTSITVDPAGPDGRRGWYVDTVTVKVAADEPAAVRCARDPVTEPTAFAELPDRACGPFTVKSHGRHVIYAAATDRAGNTSTVVKRMFKHVGRYRCLGAPPTHIGTSGDDTIVGTPGVDVIVALAGNDTIRGRGGNDFICAGAGKDSVLGGPGADRLLGHAGRDLMLGGDGADALTGGVGNDVLLGGPGDDTLLGGLGNDLLDGGRGIDVLRGGPGRNRMLTAITGAR